MFPPGDVSVAAKKGHKKMLRQLAATVTWNTVTWNSVGRFVAFFGVGAAGAVGYVLLSTMLSAAGIEAWISSLSSYLGLIPIVYLAQRNLAFRIKTSHRSSFPKYIVTQILGLMLSAVLPYFFTGATSAPPFFVFIGVALVITTISFLLLNFWTFRSHA